MKRRRCISGFQHIGRNDVGMEIVSFLFCYQNRFRAGVAPKLDIAGFVSDYGGVDRIKVEFTHRLPQQPQGGLSAKAACPRRVRTEIYARKFCPGDLDHFFQAAVYGCDVIEREEPAPDTGLIRDDHQSVTAAV